MKLLDSDELDQVRKVAHWYSTADGDNPAGDKNEADLLFYAISWCIEKGYLSLTEKIPETERQD